MNPLLKIVPLQQIYFEKEFPIQEQAIKDYLSQKNFLRLTPQVFKSLDVVLDFAVSAKDIRISRLVFDIMAVYLKEFVGLEQGHQQSNNLLIPPNLKTSFEAKLSTL